MNDSVTYSEYYLYPSTLYVSKSPCLISTLLGSCVSICLWDPNLKVGGMNHYMMPFWNGQGLASPKYGNIALSTLLENMLYIGCQKKNLVAKVFGGSELLNSGVLHSFTGNRNIAIAFELLKDENIQVISHSIGGEKGRKIHFNTLTGQVRQKYL